MSGLAAPGSSTYNSDTLHVGDGTWDSTRDDFLLPNLVGLNFETMRYNGVFGREIREVKAKANGCDRHGQPLQGAPRVPRPHSRPRSHRCDRLPIHGPRRHIHSSILPQRWTPCAAIAYLDPDHRLFSCDCGFRLGMVRSGAPQELDEPAPRHWTCYLRSHHFPDPLWESDSLH
jgi:hypothetical protein